MNIFFFIKVRVFTYACHNVIISGDFEAINALPCYLKLIYYYKGLWEGKRRAYFSK